MPELNHALPATKARRVKTAFMGVFGIALLIIMGGFATAIYLVETNVRERDLAERSAAVANLFAAKLGKDGNLMRAVGHAMMGNIAIEQAFRNGDRNELERHGRGLFEILKRDHHITHLYFDRPDRVNLYRFHSPADFGDQIARATMLQSHAHKSAFHGLELGSLGTLTLRTVMPWRLPERNLGFIEIGEEIEHLIEEIRETLAVDLLVLVNKRYLAQKQWRRGQMLMDRQGEWDRFASHVVQAQTSARLPAELDDRVLSRLMAGATAEVEDHGQSLHLALVPLHDAGGHHIGELVVLRDVTALETTFKGYMAAVVLLCLGVAAGVFSVFYVALQRVEQDYQRQHDLEHRLLRLDTEHHRILQLEKLSALGTMVGSIAHQLNNPLVGVVNMAQLAEREADDPVRIRELLGEIRRAGADCRAFVRRMLEFTKASRFESKPTPIASLIEDTVLMFRQTESRHLPVNLELPEQAPIVTLDPVLIRHALFNLLQNAAEATEGNAAITIRLEARDDPDTGQPGWELAVIDQGRGIPPEVLDKVFVPFFTTRSDGTGLGLSVVQQIALLHNGHVTANALPEGGTRFALWIPRETSPQ